MLVLQLLPVVLSLLVLGAHFLRRGDVLWVVLALGLLALLLVRRPWAARVLQLSLILGAAEWVRALIVLASYRARLDLPVTRLVVILGSVALVTLLSALVFRSGRVRAWFRLRPPAGPPASP